MTAGDGAACLAYVHGSEVAHSWRMSMIELWMHDLARHQRVMRGGLLAMRYGTGGIVGARNEVVSRFPGRAAEWLFWIDTDMGCQSDTLDRLIAAADPDSRPIVGGPCFAQVEHAVDGMGGYLTTPVPTLYREQEAAGRAGIAPWLDYPRDQLVEVVATGSACIVIHRTVLEKLAAEHGPTWYTPIGDPQTGKRLSEDLSFCIRARAAGWPTHVDTRVKTTHLKHLWLGEHNAAVAVPA